MSISEEVRLYRQAADDAALQGSFAWLRPLSEVPEAVREYPVIHLDRMCPEGEHYALTVDGREHVTMNPKDYLERLLDLMQRRATNLRIEQILFAGDEQ